MPEYQGKGVGRELAERLIAAADEKEIKYVTLYYNESSPWLVDFYRSLGFESIENAMQRMPSP